MDERSKILRFPGRFQCPSEPSDDWDDDSDDFEAWEVHAELFENEDYPGLVDYCEREVARHPEDLHAQNRLGDAYVLNGQYEKAIHAMGECHRRFPDIDAFQHVILDALFASGKAEEDYDWIRKPCVLRIGRAVLDDCHDYLCPKRRPREVEELRLELMSKGYLTFSAEELLQALADDPRFVIQPGQMPEWAQVRVRRKRESRTKPCT